MISIPVFGFDLDPITIGFCIFMFGIFLVFTIVNQRNHCLIRGEINKSLKNFEEDLLAKNKMLNRNWNNYAATFFKVNGKVRSDKDAYHYFEPSLIFSNTWVGQLKLAVPNLLVGIGIFGTFFGLAVGISGFDTSTSESIQESITSLLKGISTAFITSLFGMGFSIAYTFWDKIVLGKTIPALADFNNFLNGKYLLGRDELLKIEQENQRESFREVVGEYFLSEEKGEKIYPKRLLKILADESYKQTRSLQTFADDLAEKINSASQVIIDQYNQRINELLEGKLLPLLTAIQQVLQETSSKAIEDAIATLEQAMRHMVGDFKNSLSESTKQELESLAKILAEVGEKLIQFPANLQTTTNSLTESVSGHGYNIELLSELTDKFRDTMERNMESQKALQELILQTKGAQKNLQDLAENIKTTSNSFVKVGENLDRTSGEVNAGVKQFTQGNRENLDQMKRLLDQSGILLENYVSKFRVIEAGLSQIFGEIQNGLNDYQKTTRDSLEKYLGTFAGGLTEAVKAMESSVQGLKEIAEDLSEDLDKQRTSRPRY